MGTKYLPILFIVLFLLSGCQSQNRNSVTVKSNAVSDKKKSLSTLTVTIHEAALNGDLSQVSMHLERDISADTLDQESRTPLMYAAFNGHTEIMKLLIGNKADVNLCDKNGTTALMMASSGPYPDAVKLLLDNNADPNLIDKAEHFTALMYAASEGHMENVKILLSRQANPVLKDIDGDDAETFARNNGHPEIANLIKSFKK